jgi:hypothetical protein
MDRDSIRVSPGFILPGETAEQENNDLSFDKPADISKI